MLVFSCILCVCGAKKTSPTGKRKEVSEWKKIYCFDFSSRAEAAVKPKDKDFHY